MEKRFSQTKSERARQWCAQFMSETTCRSCGGGRLRPESAAVRVGGTTLVELSSYTVAQALAFFEKLELSGSEQQIASEVLKEIRSPLGFLAARRGWVFCRSIAPGRRSRVARRSASAWGARSARS